MNVYLSASGFLRVPLYRLASAYAPPGPRNCWHSHAVGGGNPGMGGHSCCGVCVAEASAQEAAVAWESIAAL
jgi:hypothetical protein